MSETVTQLTEEDKDRVEEALLLISELELTADQRVLFMIHSIVILAQMLGSEPVLMAKDILANVEEVQERLIEDGQLRPVYVHKPSEVHQ